jgi:hypothetical protein
MSQDDSHAHLRLQELYRPELRRRDSMMIDSQRAFRSRRQGACRQNVAPFPISTRSSKAHSPLLDALPCRALSRAPHRRGGGGGGGDGATRRG